MHLNLSALVNLEWLLRDGAELSPLDATDQRAIVERARAGCELAADDLHRAAAVDRGFRRALALGWLAAMEQRNDVLPGPRIVHGLSVAQWLLVLCGLLTGYGTAAALLAYDGSSPVNVLRFVFVLFVLQVFLLGFTIWFFVGTRGSGRGPGVVHRAIAWLGQRFGGKGAGLDEALHSLRARRGLYADVERWALFALAQTFAVAFNVSALLVVVHAGLFTDLTFCWSTTVIDGGTMQGLVLFLSLPFCWFEAAVPTAEIVSASQWSRMPGAFVDSTTAERALLLAESWWRFLFAGLLVYGVLPRLLAFGCGRWFQARALARTGFDHAGYQRLFERLLPRAGGWQGPEPGAVVGAEPAAGRLGAAPLVPSMGGVAVAFVGWGSLARRSGAVVAQLAQRLGSDVRNVVVAGGAELAADNAAVEQLGNTDAVRVILLVAAGHQPTADVRDFLVRLRTTLGCEKPVVVALLGAEVGEQQAWKRSLGALDDPYLWVERMEAI